MPNPSTLDTKTEGFLRDLTRQESSDLRVLLNHMRMQGIEDPLSHLEKQLGNTPIPKYLRSMPVGYLQDEINAAILGSAAKKAMGYLSGLDKEQLKAYASDAADYAGRILHNINRLFNPFRRGLTLSQRCTAFTRNVLAAYGFSLAGCGGNNPLSPDIATDRDANPARVQLPLDHYQDRNQADDSFENALHQINPLLRAQYDLLKTEYESKNPSADFDARAKDFLQNIARFAPREGMNTPSEGSFLDSLPHYLRASYQLLMAEYSKEGQHYSPGQLADLEIRIAGFLGDVRQQQPNRASKVTTLAAEPRYVEGGTNLDSDFNFSGSVEFGDFVDFAQAYGTRVGQAGYDARFDLDGDGQIGFNDFVLFAMQYGLRDGKAPGVKSIEVGENSRIYHLTEPIGEDQLRKIEVLRDGQPLSGSTYNVYFMGSPQGPAQKADVHRQEISVNRCCVVVETGGLGSGDYEIRLRPADPAGNQMDYSDPFTIEESQDTTPPTTTGFPASVEVDEGSVAPSIYLKGKVSDNNTPFSELEKTAQGTDLVPAVVRNDSLVFARPLVNPDDANGSANVVLTITDQAGNSTQVVIPYSINPKPDLSGPVESIFGPRVLSNGQVYVCHVDMGSPRVETFPDGDFTISNTVYPVGAPIDSTRTDGSGFFENLQLPGPGTYALVARDGNNILVQEVEVAGNNDQQVNVPYIPSDIDSEAMSHVVGGKGFIGKVRDGSQLHYNFATNYGTPEELARAELAAKTFHKATFGIDLPDSRIHEVASRADHVWEDNNVNVHIRSGYSSFAGVSFEGMPYVRYSSAHLGDLAPFGIWLQEFEVTNNNSEIRGPLGDIYRTLSVLPDATLLNEYGPFDDQVHALKAYFPNLSKLVPFHNGQIPSNFGGGYFYGNGDVIKGPDNLVWLYAVSPNLDVGRMQVNKTHNH